MDKYEYKVRAEEIHNLIAEQEYARAVEIADTIDWRRVKSIKTLCTISDLYKINRRYQESKEILLMAYERYPGGRLIVYSLCELSIKLEEYVQAIEYYKEYVQLAPKDSNRYILQYRLYEAQDVSLEERIEVLEEFKRKDYREKWGYELAYLYHRMGLGSKCVDECDELIVTFGEGRYVIKAMELKKLHEPLTASEQEKYDSWMQERNEEIEEENGGYQLENTTSDVDGSTDNTDLVGAPTTELPPEEEIQVKTVDVGQYNTINLQQALADSMKDIWEGDTETVPEPPSSPEEDVEDNTIFGTGPLAGPMYARDPESFDVDKWEHTGELPASDPVRIQPVAVPDVSDMRKDVSAIKPSTCPDEILSEETKRIPSEAVVDYIEAHRLKEQIKQDTESLTATESRTEEIPGAVTGEIELPPEYTSAYDGMLAQESDGQIRLAIPDSNEIEKQITGQLSIEDIMAEWERAKKENEEKRKQEVKERILQHTGSLFDEFDEDTRATLLEQLEKAFRDAIDREAKNGRVESEELNRRINAEARKAVEYLSREDNGEDREAQAVIVDRDEAIRIEEDDEGEDDEITDETGIEIPDEEPSEEAADDDSSPAEEDESEEISDESEDEDEEEDDIPEDDTKDTESVRAVIEALAQDDDDVKDATSKGSENTRSTEEVRSLGEEEEQFFATYLTRKSTRHQVEQTLEKMSLASYTGNILITGEEGVGTLDLAKRLIKYLQSVDSNFLGQAAKVTGKAFNDKDIETTIEKLKGGALIIETARGMKKSTVERLLKCLEREDLGILVILEDTATGIDRISNAIPELTQVFNARIDLHALDDRALVTYAREYALSQEYSIDEFGMLALHTRIEEMQTNDHQVNVSEVRDLVDDAIYYAEKKTPKHFFDVVFHKRYDDEDMVVLREKDFMHY